MNVFGVIELFGGLAMFLYGMSMLGNGLERASGGRLERTLEKLTSNVFAGVAFGALVTACIQSSSATTVIVVGLVNARVLKLRNAIGVIMGANIGTTVTAHILRLSELKDSNFLLKILKPSTLAPLAAIIGILFVMAAKREKFKSLGIVLLGFAILFTGMFSMETAVSPLQDVPQFKELFKTFSNPILGVLVGTIVTAVIQSSSASVGILQALTATGFITYSAAFPIIMGQNIGTCITPVLASIGASKNAKRTAVVHVTFNILGTIFFLIGFYTYQHFVGFSFWEQSIDKGGIANFHTIFNVTTTLLFMPFTALLEKIACRIVKDKTGEFEKEPEAVTLDERLMVSPGLAIDHVRMAVLQMSNFAQTNYQMATALLHQYDAKVFERIRENEDVVDKLQDRVETYLLKLSDKQLTEHESRSITELLQTSESFERVADHAQNIAECAQKMFENRISFSKKATEEMQVICEAVSEILADAHGAFETHGVEAAAGIEPLEQVIDEMEKTLRDRHIERLRRGKCTVDAAFPFVETLTDIERIADHCSNIALSSLTFSASEGQFDKHDYVRQLHERAPEAYQNKYIVYLQKYYNRIRRDKPERSNLPEEKEKQLQKPISLQKPEKPAKQEKAEKGAKAGKTGKTDKAVKAPKQDKVSKKEKTAKSAKSEKSSKK